MNCVVVTPEKTIFDEEIDFAALPFYDGEYGVAAGHTPVIGRLGAGELRLTKPDQTTETWYVEGGFAEVLDNKILLLTAKAFPIEKLNLEEAEKNLEAVLNKQAVSEEAQLAKSQALDAARAKVRLAKKHGK